MVPVYTGLQFQGDVAVIPTDRADRIDDGRPQPVVVPAAGIPVVRGENGANTHLLLAAGPCTWLPVDRSGNGLDLGVLGVPADATAWLAHPEHGYLGIGPGRYVIRRQREQADEIRLVAD
jgi:hypothetical protein